MDWEENKISANAQQRPHSRAATVWFLLILAFMILVAPMVPGLPLIGPLVALLTPLRRSRWRMIILWFLAAAHVVHLYFALLAWDGSWPDWLMFDQEDHDPAG
jgi:hypothetical protein